MMRYQSLFAAALLATAVPAAAQAQACKPKHTFKTIEPGTITVAVGNYAPYAIINADGVLVGIDGEIMAEIAKIECLKVRPIAAENASGVQYVLSKKADAAAADFFRTAARARIVYLSAPLYLDQMALYSKEGYDSISQLEGKTIGASLGVLWVADLQKVFGDKLRLYQTTVAMDQDLMDGRIDAVVDAESVGIMAKQKGQLQGIKIAIVKPDVRVAVSKEAGQGCFPLPKDNTEMDSAFDEDIAQLHKDGTIAKILVKYGLSDKAATTGEPRLIK